MNGKVLMYGYSHGGCITYRAVEQGAPVTAFSVIEGFTDLRLTYLTGRNARPSLPNWPPSDRARFTPASPAFYLPDANGVMGYNWRSAHYFASRGDLGIQKFKTMPILILHGDIDTTATRRALSIRSSSMNRRFRPTSGPRTSLSAPTACAADEPAVIAGPEGAPCRRRSPPATMSCPISFTPMNTAILA